MFYYFFFTSCLALLRYMSLLKVCSHAKFSLHGVEYKFHKISWRLQNLNVFAIILSFTLVGYQGSNINSEIADYQGKCFSRCIFSIAFFLGIWIPAENLRWGVYSGKHLSSKSISNGHFSDLTWITSNDINFVQQRKSCLPEFYIKIVTCLK